MRTTSISLLGALAWCAIAMGEPVDQAKHSQVLKKLGEMPVSFEPNRGQAARNVQFISRGLRHDLSFTASGARLNVSGSDQAVTSIDLRFANAGANPTIAGVNPLEFQSNYFIGNNPENWIKQVPNFSAVRYSQVWKGMDVVFYGNEKRLEYDIVVAPGANPKNAVVVFGSAQSLSLNSQGDLVLHFEQGDVLQQKPLVYQTINNRRKEIPARYAIAGNRVSFEIGQYDKSRELVIDPTLSFSIPNLDGTYVSGAGVAVDGTGNIYAVGTTTSVLVTPTVAQITAWIEKIDPKGNVIGKFSLAAADGPITGNAIASDSVGNLYITGMTGSPGGLPGSGVGFQRANGGGGTDAYLVRVNSNVSLAYGTYIGGSGADSGNAVAADNFGHVFVAGSTSSSNFPNTVGRLYMGAGDAFLTRIDTNVTGSISLSFSELIGGTGVDSAQGVAIDSSLNVYVAGSTTSTDFQPTSANGYSTSKGTVNPDGFVLKLTPAGTTALYFTFYPFGPVNAIALDSSLNAYVTGQTNGFIPTQSVTPGYQLSGGTGHAFVAKFGTNTSGVNSLLYATYLAGSSSDNGKSIATDGVQTAYVSGTTSSANFPMVNATQAGYGGGAANAFVSVINTGVSGVPSLTFSTFLGGSGSDSANAIAVNLYNNPTIVGLASSPNFPGNPGAPPSAGGAFAAKLLFEAAPFGVVDTPAKGATGLAGAINFTGWALSPITVANIGLWREPISGETPTGNGLIFLGNAPQVPGARPDVAATHPGFPNNNYGWGAQILTNQLPGTNGLPLGNGTYKLHAIASDPEGMSTDLSGAVTISVNNATSLLPFGTIDTPGPGQTISGASFANFGWVLTAQPNIVPIDGSTIAVVIDGVAVGHPVYNQFRSDIATLFPGYRNSNGAVGAFILDTTKLSNGRHNIAWGVIDSAGNTQGIGSRDFFVQN